MTQMELALGIAARDRAVDKVEAGAGPEWMEEALDVLFSVASRQKFFTTDDLWAAGLPQHREPRAVGALMRKAHRGKAITPTEKFVQSRRRARHAGPIRVWESMLFKGTW